MQPGHRTFAELAADPHACARPDAGVRLREAVAATRAGLDVDAVGEFHERRPQTAGVTRPGADRC